MKNLYKVLAQLAIMVVFAQLTGCVTPSVTTSREIQPAVNETQRSKAFQPVECWFEVPDEANVNCGYVSVPEDRAQAMTENNTVRLAVAIFRSRSETPTTDPVVYQVGGPGGHMLGIAPYLYQRVIAPFLDTRDLILFDPRGTGFSQPALECMDEEMAGDCVRRLFSEGHNLYSYNSVSMAKDLQSLRAALGYDAWNLLGESYGTHVAQVALREAPDGLRSVILDSVMPVVIPDLPDGSSPFDISLQRLFEGCKSDPDCNAANPALRDALVRAVQRLDASPVPLQTNCYGAEKHDVLTGQRLVSMLLNALYEADFVPILPYAITAAANGSEYSFWNNVVCWEVVIDYLLTDGAHWAVQCGDGRLSGECEDWPVVVEPTAVASSVPVLILNGEFDPVTPLEYGHSVAASLTHSYVVDFPGMGHWVNGTGHPCQSSIIQAFLNNPAHEPDTSCIQTIQKIDFYIPEEAGTILLGK